MRTLKLGKYKYKCGHSSSIIQTNVNLTSHAAYEIWRTSVGVNGTKEMCFFCFCDGLNAYRKKKYEALGAKPIESYEKELEARRQEALKNAG